MNRFIKLLLLIVFISSTAIHAEYSGLLPVDGSSQLSRVLLEESLSLTASDTVLLTSEVTNPCSSPYQMENGCMTFFRYESNNQLLQPLSLLLMALGLIGLALVTRIK
ncbi:MAG: hypothetical protein N0C88_04090 [Candidatus Thiodiazotropha lotti]|uniref:Uncharacterized protein n=1 Tax=Candidatus Thiodiazotropha lotti TaxID=2792787 RepID=A0A9E4K1P5_9GAMM|nr:hypothetical protein [Candidatus Thiodiazotropha lotti]MCG7932787.1 hypothetical protein [Candidatus Thiodiazotropha lotti]MCG7938022.1 hypothetical protein [Candidatus Thiodiazotropha lotti]MCW4202490.1 hypothetical protein [Candidatus Thiodiazotropha lotti]MCW4222638.1 hypothetical protein [Candidatus Thiodiazotropha lotti]